MFTKLAVASVVVLVVTANTNGEHRDDGLLRKRRTIQHASDATLVELKNNAYSAEYGSNALLSTHVEDDQFWKRRMNEESSIPFPNEPRERDIDAELVRSVLADFVESLDSASDIDPSAKKRGYHRKAESQTKEWHSCTIVQQCLDPHFMLSLGKMPRKSRALVYKALSKVMSQEGFNLLQLQQHSNMLLGEMQDWATTCDGVCHELDNAEGILEPVVGGDNLNKALKNTSYDECGKLRSNTPPRFTYWRCDDEPRMYHQGNIDTNTGNYMLGNIFNEPHAHGRNSEYDYFSVYGSMTKKSGAFGFRFSGHHLDLNFMFNENGDLIQDTPVFLGHNPLIVPETSPPETRAANEIANDESHFLMWENMAGIAQFAEAVEIILVGANELLTSAPDAYVPLNNWDSEGRFGALFLADNKDITDFPYLDLSIVPEETFNKFWEMVKYTLKFARGNGEMSKERTMFRNEGKVIWTTSNPPKEGLPLTEDDMRRNMNFIDVYIETDEWMFFVMVNQMYVVVSESEPTNHMHSILVPKKMKTCDHSCCDNDPICKNDPPHEVIKPTHTNDISSYYQWESSMWPNRYLKGRSTLDIDAFDYALKQISCGTGITATLFNDKSEQVYQNSVGTNYIPFKIPYSSDTVDGWTGDTSFTLFSNAKVISAIIFLASVVDTGLGLLDEPIYKSFPEYLNEKDEVGKITPRMILSHRSGLKDFDRYDPADPYYGCKYNPENSMAECLKVILNDETLVAEPGTVASYNNGAFDILAVLITRKTGYNNMGDVLKTYVTEPLGMQSTTYDCPMVNSTSEKPHVAWGICSTGNDMPKLVQVLANNGKTLDGKQIISAASTQQILSQQSHGALPIPINFNPSCTVRKGAEQVGLTSEMVGYGLGTMIFPGVKGQWFMHLASVGGLWIIAPGRFSAYFAFMTDPSLYVSLSLLLDSFEKASTFEVSSDVERLGRDFGQPGLEGTENWNEISTCVDGMLLKYTPVVKLDDVSC